MTHAHIDAPDIERAAQGRDARIHVPSSASRLRGKRVLVVGGGLTGGSVARFLARHDVPFDLVDDGGVPDNLAALAGGRVHASLTTALVLGYQVIVLSPGIPRSHAAIVAALAAGVPVIGDIELFAGAVRAPLVAVTGSNGKSTVVAWLADLLGRLGVSAVACGNIGLPALDSLDPDAAPEGATPDGVAPRVSCHVLELSSYQLESTTSLAPRASVVLNVSDDHRDRYASPADYAATKRRVHEHATFVVVNADDDETRPDDPETPLFARFTTRPPDRVVTESAVADPAVAPVGAPIGDRPTGRDTPRGVLWHLGDRDGEPWLCRDRVPLLACARLALPGAHNAANALVVLALLEALEGELAAVAGHERADVFDALCAFPGLPHRTELVGEAAGVRWYNDSKGTNVDACVKALEAMPGPVLLIAGGLSKGADFTPLRAVVARVARAVVLIGRDRMDLHGALDGAVVLHLADSLAEAVSLCARLACAGDAVLLSPACASFDMFEDFTDRGRHFAARVEEALAA